MQDDKESNEKTFALRTAQNTTRIQMIKGKRQNIVALFTNSLFPLQNHRCCCLPHIRVAHKIYSDQNFTGGNIEVGERLFTSKSSPYLQNAVQTKDSQHTTSFQYMWLMAP